jgi:hypothetical protein
MQNQRVDRQTVSRRVVRHQASILMSIVLFIALSMVLSSVARAQTECLGACEEQYASCINSGHVTMLCQDTYEDCVNSCVGSSAVLLG